ncbi:beta-carotene 15,15'-monooxygenase [Chryseobacterium nematophagum]|uniref:Beta-carotene 15,15'-monooxygenase n=1 Tax=Chryseobacterium nematophagum TaxID=2305228 RepID=A0A3M7TG77_9FLAO|nr:beta-carotene 15,15'-monooxygenase [Chryseobacterium nematophagum]RMZ59276.1 beta-carotene 15,15'-monooxygenase [Chryseobacterium nematophagum]RNA61639.1 beta-carotene 15,15'-monooxygenase [Chryseobacterium nematophagum]
MPEFDLDSFKKTWQEQPVQQKYDNNEILQMLNRKSRNYVKYIFWISVVEFLFFTSLGLFYIIQGKESNSFINILEKLGVRRTPEIEHSFDNIYLALKILSLSITAYFVYKFYQNHKQIKIEENLKKFISKIIQFKKTVNMFILLNIGLLITFTSIFTVFVFYVLNTQNIAITNSALTGFLIGIVLSTALSVLLIWVYYRLLYGIIMKRLDKNLKQLKDIDSQEN